MLLLRLCLLLGAAAAYGPAHDKLEGYTFERYERDFQKQYEPAERLERQEIFTTKLGQIREHNDHPSNTWKMGVNHLSDRTESERRIRGLDKSLLHHHKQLYAAPTAAAGNITGLPAAVDWRSHSPSIISPVKNQGSCGSCWTFAATETAESHWALKTGHLEDLSEQFILDCIPNTHQCGGTGGCAGGTAALAFEGLKARGGQPSEWTYPYTSGTGKAARCQAPAHIPLQHPHSGAIMLAANVTGHVALPTNSYEAMLHAVATQGPLVVVVDAGAWHDYEAGVFNGGNHTHPDLDHLVQLVGYGTGAQGDYWLVRNSWTPEWGDEGYIKVARSSTPSCGVDLAPLDGDGCAKGPNKSPASVRVCGTSGILYDGAYPLM